jgi:Ca2+-dependent lipid-binding protein
MRNLMILPFIFLIGASFCAELNNSYNETLLNDSALPWYAEYGNKFLSSDNSGLVAIIIGLSLAYLIGKFAFKFIKLAVIILLIILLVRIIF